MMFSTIGTWKRFAIASEVESDRSSIHAQQMKDDAQALSSTTNVRRQHSLAVRVSGLRIQHWPQFFLLWQIIGCISAYDAYLAMKYRVELRYMEENILGRLLLYVNGGDPALFLGVKFMSTLMVLGILTNLYHIRPQWGMVIAKSVAAFQVGLLVYLTLV